MLAVRTHGNSPELQLDTVPVPTPAPHDVLIKVASAGIAPGIFNPFLRKFMSLPTTLGHEVSGTVVSVGGDVSTAAVGDRVRVHANLSCLNCKYCLSDREQMCAQAAILGFRRFGDKVPLYETYNDGGLAEYVKVPHWLVDKLPANVSFDVGAKVHDVANAMRTLKCAGLEPGSTIIITAPTGGMGTATLKLAQFFPISRIILVGRSAERMRTVTKLTQVPTEIVALEELEDDWPNTKALVKALRHLSPGGVDAILDYMPSGKDIWQAMGALAQGGTIVHMGGNSSLFPMPAVAIMTNCWRIVGTRGCTRSDTNKVLEWLGDGRLQLEDLITHKFELKDTLEAVSKLQARSLPIWMGVIHP
jgi:threonine dehydrogenase-like Zn-dependent dehydrogenase